MKKLRKVFVVGLGAIGGSYAARLYDAGTIDLAVIADRDRIEKYSRDKLTVNGKVYDFRFVLPEQEGDYADLILIAVKYAGLKQAIDSIRKRVGPDTIILSLLNGIDSEEIISKELNIEMPIYSTCVGIDAIREGNTIRYTSFGRLLFGEAVNKLHSEKVEQVKELLDEAGIPYEVPENMIKSLWWKYMLNVGVNQVSAILRANYGVLRTVPEVKELITSAMREVAAVAAKVGVDLGEADIEETHKILEMLSADGKTSMLQDIEAGRKTEVEMFSGVLRELGRKYQVPTPVNDTLFNMIRTLEQMK